MIKVYYVYIKRILDLGVSILILPFLLPVYLIVSFLIKLEDDGPILYIANRLGKNGKLFKMYKFRSMKVNAPDIRNDDGSTFNAEDDPRLTKVGKILRKTSIDETPQLLNVIKGDMSLVGPRPDLPEHIEVYDNHDIKKLNVRPGITGYNQAYYRNTISFKKRLKNDRYYVENLSFKLDVLIIIFTVYSVVKGKNIYSEEK